MSKSEELKEYYYYLRDEQNRPAVTVCLIVDNDSNEYFRGIAVTSDKDMPSKKEGRRIARGRSLRAIGMHKSTMKMDYQKALDLFSDNFNTVPEYKSVYSDDLSGLNAMERKLMKV